MYYAYCYCRECLNMDLSDINRYNSNESYCTEYHKYYNPNSKACSSYFRYNENLKKESGCYLTTITCDIMNLDDSYLDILRNFRDNYMKKDINLLPLLIEYDIIGPIIVENLKEDNFKRTRCLMMLENYIKPITKLLNDKKYNAAINKYIEMTRDLCNFYKIEIPVINIKNIDINDIGKGHIKIRN